MNPPPPPPPHHLPNGSSTDSVHNADIEGSVFVEAKEEQVQKISHPQK